MENPGIYTGYTLRLNQSLGSFWTVKHGRVSCPGVKVSGVLKYSTMKLHFSGGGEGKGYLIT